MSAIKSTKKDGDSVSCTPFWLHWFVFVIFALCFAACLVALELLYRLSVRNNGLSTVDQDQHYLWTYGPTAILTIILALWSRVDYRVRQMHPWVRLNNLVTIDYESMFIDYITPTVPEILWYSFRLKHFFVAASTLMTIFITVLIIISTSLLNPEIHGMRLNNVAYTTTSEFTFDIENLGNVAYSSLPMDMIDAIDQEGLLYPFGTTKDVAFQTFRPQDPSIVGLQQATVDVATVEMQCEPAKLNVTDWRFQWLGCPDPEVPTSNLSATLTAGNCSVEPEIWYEYADDGHIGNYAFIDEPNCGGISPFDGDVSNRRIVFGVGQVKQIGTAGPQRNGCNETIPDGAEIQVLRSKQWICSPRHVLVKGDVIFNSSNTGAGALPTVNVHDSEKRYLSTTVNFQMVGSFSSNQENSNVELTDVPDSLDLFSISFDTVRNTVGRLLRPSPNVTIDELLETDVFSDLTQAFWKRLQVQTLHAALTANVEDDSLRGAAVLDQSRLVVRETPLRIMEAILATNITLALFLLFSHAYRTTDDPARLAGMIGILRSRDSLLGEYKGTGPLDLKELRDRVGSNGGARSLGSPDGEARRKRISWWRPIVVTVWARSAMFLFVVLLVVAAEVLLHFSKRDRGLVDVTIAGNQHLAWSVLPALVMSSVAVYFRALGSNYKLFSPYHRLRRDASWRALYSNYAALTEFETVIRSLMDRQYAVSGIATATIMSALLTIVVSGVWVPTLIEGTRVVQLQQESFFSTEASSDDGSAGRNAFLSGIILGANATFPRWTSDNIALASFSTSDEDIKPGEFLEITLPAIRPSLDCTLYDKDEIPGLTYFDTSYGIGSHSLPPRVELNMPGPGNCSQTGTYIDFQRPYDVSIGWAAFVSGSQDGCPSLNYFWGQQNVSAAEVTFMKALVCYESIEQIQVDVTLTDQLDLVDSKKPIIEDNTVEQFSATHIGLPYDNLPQFSSEEIAVPGFWATLYYKCGIKLADYGRDDMVNNIIECVKTTHGVIRAQQYNAALRVNQLVKRDAGSAQALSAVIRTPQRYRLVQDDVSTHLLCSLLTVMVLLGLLASWLASTNYVLPKNPGSVAAVVSLLADSNVFEDESLLEALSSAGRHGRYESPGLQGRRFRLGWTADERQGERAFTVNCLDSHDLEHGQERKKTSISHSCAEVRNADST